MDQIDIFADQYAEALFRFFAVNKDVYDGFCNALSDPDCDYSMAEYINSSEQLRDRFAQFLEGHFPTL